MATTLDNPTPAPWRTPLAIALAFAAGVASGLFLSASAAAPFGPVLLGWFEAIVGGFVISGALCVLATRFYVLVGAGYAAGIAVSVVVKNVVIRGRVAAWWGPLAQFAVVLAIVGCSSLLASSLVALLMWEDRRARAKEQ